MQVEEETDGLDVDDEFMSAVSCMSSPTSSGGGCLRPASAKSSTDHHYHYQHRHSTRVSSSTTQSPPRANADWDEDDEDEETVGKNDERQKLLQNNDHQQQLHYPQPYSSPSLSACTSELLPLRGRLSSPPELVVEDHSRFGEKSDLILNGEQSAGLSSSLHLNIPCKSARPRRSSSGSAISVASSVSSNRSSYRSALDHTARSSIANGSLKNYPSDGNCTTTESGKSAPKSETCISPWGYCTLEEWHPLYLKPPLVAHPLQENMLLSLLISCVNYACGLFIGIPIAIFLFLWTCLVIPLRLFFYLATRLSVKGLCRWLWRKDHCDPFWPLGGGRRLATGEEDFGDTTLFLATTQGGFMDVGKIRQLLWRRLINLKDSNGYLCYSKFSSKLRHTSEECCDAGCLVAVWTQDQRFDMKSHVTSSACSDPDLEIETLRDLETYINRLLHDPAYALNKKRPLWDVKTLIDFGASGSAPETKCTLLIMRLHSAITDSCLCPLKFLTLINDGQLSFDCEPRMRGDDWPPFNLFVTASFHLWHAFTIVSAGPMCFLNLALRKAQNPVWDVASGNEVKYSRDEETGDCGGKKAKGRRLKATWARVPQADQLMKLERILRCSIQELLLAFVAGALRRHFRSRGIKHPPDLYASVPVTFRDYMPIGRTFPCHFVLTPVQLPLSVDGAIPRIWETQRRLCESLDSAYPRTTRCIMRHAGASLPKSLLRSLVATTHRASDGFVCFWRAGGELTFADQQVHSLLIYPPLKRPSLFTNNSWLKYAFSFVQTGNEIVLSLVVDQTAFGADPDVLLRQFQYEIHGLLSHMSPRMMTLSQATFLPSPLLITRLARSPLKIVSQATAATAGTASGTETEEIFQDEEPSTVSADSETLEELEQLMATVQNELQAMKQNPRGNRGDYITKLAELEMKMESFHHSIVEKLQKREQNRRRGSVASEGAQRPLEVEPSPRRASSSSGGPSLEDEHKALLDPNFEPLLQPLRADVTELMTQEAREGAMKLRRKRSRRLESPTRLSPRVSSGSQKEHEDSPQRQRYYSTPSSSEIL